MRYSLCCGGIGDRGVHSIAVNAACVDSWRAAEMAARAGVPVDEQGDDQAAGDDGRPVECIQRDGKLVGSDEEHRGEDQPNAADGVNHL